jgi:translation initiation factor IF-2
LRSGTVIHDGEVGSLKRFKDDVREVQAGYECGLSVAGSNDVEEGDQIEFYHIEEVERTL